MTAPAHIVERDWFWSLLRDEGAPWGSRDWNDYERYIHVVLKWAMTRGIAADQLCAWLVEYIGFGGVETSR